MKRLLMLLLATGTAANCATPRRYIHYDAQKNLITAKPRYAATGDSLMLVVHDTLYRNLYTPKSDTSAVVVGERAAIFGAVDIGKLAEAFPAQFLMPHINAEATETAMETLMSPALPGKGSAAYLAFLDSKPADKNARLLALLRARDGAIHAECRAPVAAAAVYFLAHPDEYSFLKFLTDPKAYAQARRLATAGDALRVAELADTLEKRSLTILELDTLETRGLQFAQRVAALSLRFPADLKTFKPDPTQLDSVLQKLHGCVDVRLFKSKELSKTQDQIEQLVKDGAALPPGFTVAVPPLLIGDVKIDSFVEHSNDEQIADLYGNLTTIARSTALVISALNTAPTYATRYCVLPAASYSANLVSVCSGSQRTATADTIYVGTYWKPVQVRVTPVRGERFARFVAPPRVTFAAVGTPAPPSTGNGARRPGSVAKDDSRSKKKGAEDSPSRESPTVPKEKPAASPDSADTDSAETGKAEKSDSTAAPESEAPTLPSAAVDVLERYRFHVGFGYAVSTLRTHTYSSTPDTVGGVPGARVHMTGNARSQQFPIATLSYVILPLRGKVFAAQAYDQPSVKRYFAQVGLSAQFGLSLQHPTEQLFAGVASELLPGLEVGLGKHFGYGEHSDYGNNAFVSTASDATPIRKQWAHSRTFIDAFDVTVDGAAILAAFGKLLSLK